MEPITWGWLAATILSGIVGNRADAGLLEACSAGWKRATRRLGAPDLTGDDALVALALNRAFLWAQQSLVEECLDESTGGTYSGFSTYVTKPGLEAEVKWLIAKAKQLNTDLKQLQIDTLSPLPALAVTDLETLLQRQDTQSDLRAQLAAVVQREQSPTNYQKLALDQSQGLLTRLAAFFEFQLKTQPNLKDWFQRELLMQINHQLKDIADAPLEIKSLQAELQRVAQQVPDVVSRIDNLALALADVDQGVANLETLVSTRADDLMALSSQHSDDLATLKLQVGELLIELQSQPRLQNQASVVAVTVSRAGANPFIYGPAVTPERFWGRHRTRDDIKNRIGSVEPQSINIVGLRRNGKSSMLRYIKARVEEFCLPKQRPLVVLLDLQDRKFHTPEGILEGLRRGIGKQLGVNPWEKEVNDDPFELQDCLEDLRNQGYRLIVLFDEFEAIGHRLELFQEWGDDWRSKASASLVTLVIASRRPLGEIYKNLQLTSPFGNLFSTSILGGLEQKAWKSLLDQGGFDQYELDWMARTAGRLPYYTQLAAAMIWQYGAIESAQDAFWQQVRPRFQELWRELKTSEELALRHILDATLPSSPGAVTEVLKQHGVLQQNGQIWSDSFACFVRAQP